MYELRVLPYEAESILRGMMAVATGGGHRVPVPVERDLLVAARRCLLPTPADVDDLPAATPSALRASLPGEEQRLRAVHFLIPVPYVSLEADAGKLAAADAFAIQLAVDPARLRALHRRRQAELRRTALDALRRGWPLPVTVRTSSLLRGIVEASRRVRPDETLVARYRELRTLPQGSLGRALFEQHQEHGWALPGEIGGLDESLVASDVRGLLAAIDPGLAGRALGVAFAAGLARLDLGYDVVLEALIALLASARLAAGCDGPAVAPQLDVPALVDAHARGRAARLDPHLERFDDGWWALAGEDLGALRARFGITPIAPADRTTKPGAVRRPRAA